MCRAGARILRPAPRDPNTPRPRDPNIVFNVVEARPSSLFLQLVAKLMLLPDDLSPVRSNGEAHGMGSRYLFAMDRPWQSHTADHAADRPISIRGALQ
jgi:hypothetical protein